MQKEYRLFPHQKQFIESTAPITFLCCGRGAGKSYVASLLIIKSFLEGKRVIALAQTWKSLSEVLFAEVTSRLDELSIPYDFNKTSMKITYGTGTIYGGTYENLEAIRGLSNISLAVCDEAALSPSKLFPTLSPCLRGEGITGAIKLLSTPRRGSWLNLYVHDNQDKVEVITAKTSDNKFITAEQIELMKASIVNKDLLEQELNGVMLDISSDASILQMSDYQSCDKGETADAYYCGIDLAGLGADNNVFTIISKYRIEDQIVMNRADTFQLFETFKQLNDKWKIQNTCIDITGSTSNGLFDMMKKLGFRCDGVNFARKPYDEKYSNARSEMYVELANEVKNGLYIQDQDIRVELAYTTINVNDRGKLALDKKEKIKEILGHSPDRSDSLALAVYAMKHSVDDTYYSSAKNLDIAMKFITI